MQIIAITGGIKTGKTTALEYFRNKGHYTINSDKVIDRIYDTLKINKKDLQNILFKSSFKIRLFKVFIYTLYSLSCIFLIILGFLKGYSTVFIEIPLFFEFKLNYLFYSIVIYSCREKQIERMKNKKICLRIMNLQLATKYKVKHGNLKIRNDGHLIEFKNKLDEITLPSTNLYLNLLLITFVYILIKTSGS